MAERLKGPKRIVGFDVVFAERDESSGLRVLEQLAQKELRDVGGFQSALQRLQPQLDYDAIFANRMRNRAVVLGYTFTRDDEKAGTKKGLLPAPVLAPGTFAGKNILNCFKHLITACFALNAVPEVITPFGNDHFKFVLFHIVLYSVLEATNACFQCHSSNTS